MNFHSIEETDVVIYRIAQTQGEIYQCAYDLGYDLEDFSKKYLKSDFCRFEMDAPYSVYQMDFGTLAMECVQDEFKKKGISLIRRSTENLFYSPKWIGEMYRYLFFSLKICSSDLETVVPFRSLVIKEAELEECETSETASILTKQYLPFLQADENSKASVDNPNGLFFE